MDNEIIAKAVKLLQDSKLIIYPTDTLYAIGCDATNAEAVEKVYELKKRPRGMPLSVLVSDFEMLQEYADVTKEQMKILKQKLPGPFTFILKEKIKLPVSGGNIGFRMIKNKLVNAIVKKFGKPITATSANIHGQPTAATVKELRVVFTTHNLSRAQMHNKTHGFCLYIDLYVSSGRLAGRPSSVIDLTTGKILRN